MGIYWGPSLPFFFLRQVFVQRFSKFSSQISDPPKTIVHSDIALEFSQSRLFFLTSKLVLKGGSVSIYCNCKLKLCFLFSYFLPEKCINDTLWWTKMNIWLSCINYFKCEITYVKLLHMVNDKSTTNVLI